MEDVNEINKNEEIRKIKEYLKELIDNIPYLLNQINEIMSSDENSIKKSVHFLSKISKELGEINQKLNNFNISQFEKSCFKQKENSYSNKISYNNSFNSNNNLSIAKKFYNDSFDTNKNDYCPSSNNITFNIDNCSNNLSNNLYNSSDLDEQITNSFFEIIIDIFEKFKSFIYSNKIDKREEFFTDFLDDMNKVIMTFKSQYNENNNTSIVKNEKSFDSILSLESKLINIKSFEELENHKKNSYIFSIIINYEKRLQFLSVLKELELYSLEKLELRNNKIKDISPLLNPSLYFLEKLDLECNDIDNDCISVLKEVKFHHLKYLNLFKNKITSIEIFEVIRKFKDLETFYIGYNPFCQNEINNNQKKYLLPENLVELGMTANFNNESIYFIIYLNLNHLKALFLSENNLKSLKCLENFNFKNLEVFWAKNNQLIDINEIQYLKDKKTIEKINLCGNKINTLDKNIYKLLAQFPNLKYIDLLDNPIKDKKKTKRLIEKILNEKKKIYIYNYLLK